MQRDQHEQKAGQGKKEANSGMPLSDKPHPGIVNQRLPMKVVVVKDMKKKDQISSKKTYMVKTRQMRKIFGIHTKI